MTEKDNNSGASILTGVAAGTTIKEGIHLLSAQGHVLVVEMKDSVVMVDCEQGALHFQCKAIGG